MSSSEEDSYSMIFASLKHPIRRKILRILSSEPQSFSDLQKQFKIESSHLTYHLDGLGNLLYKAEDGKYALSSLGEAAVSMMKNVEEPPNMSHFPLTHARSNTGQETLATRTISLALGIICILLAVTVVGAFAYYVPLVDNKNTMIASLNSQVSNLQNQTDSYNASVANLQDQIYSLQSQIAELESIVSSDNVTIANLNSTQVSLDAKIANLTNELDLFETWVLNETVTLLNQTQASSMAQGSKDGLQLTIALEKTLFRLSEPVNVTLEVTNISNQSMDFYEFPSWWDFLVFNDTSNTLYSYLFTSGYAFPMHGITIRLDPGRSYTYEVLIWPQLYNITVDRYGAANFPVSPGTYYMVGEYAFFGTGYKLQTAPVKITILPF
jgi:DNA-binding transcriptional ArsR family regulator